MLNKGSALQVPWPRKRRRRAAPLAVASVSCPDLDLYEATWATGSRYETGEGRREDVRSLPRGFWTYREDHVTQGVPFSESIADMHAARVSNGCAKCAAIRRTHDQETARMAESRDYGPGVWVIVSTDRVVSLDGRSKVGVLA
ncbi:hypothetical protein BD309DRAFT_957288 [Dichomitus squalens]|nr:hypothetical protein BD309DRAFT_957288 [Dichomitus squalens]